MPPDRKKRSSSNQAADRSTATSFTAAAVLQLPLSSHSAKHAPSLERGKACLVCRSRKIKCDALMPACTSCRKSATAKGEDPDLIRCDYDEPEKRRRPVGGGKVSGLEAKIAALERRIEELTAPQGQSDLPTPSSDSTAVAKGTEFPELPELPVLNQTNDWEILRQGFPATPQASTSTAETSIRASTAFDTTVNPARLAVPSFDAHPLPPAESTYTILNDEPTREVGDIAHHAYFVQSHSCHRPPVPMPPPLSLPAPSPLLELFYPGWPNTLPSPALVFRLVESFFARSHLVSLMINRTKLMASLQLPPNHTNFPITPLLHAIIAIASSIVSDDVWLSEERYWGANETPADWHGRQAKKTIESSWVNDDNYVQTAQTAVLICFLSYSSARFGEVWLECGQAIRLCIPLGLNHLRALNHDALNQQEPTNIKSNMLLPTNDAQTLHELSCTFWFAVTCDKFAAASTGWAMNLDDSDITTLLPGPPGFVYPAENLNSSPLSIHNPHFLISHPPEMVSSLQMYLKAVVLMGRVVSYLQRSPSPVGVGVNNGPPRHRSEPMEQYLDQRNSAAFKQLDQDIIGFQLSIPREYQQLALHIGSDINVSLIHAIPHAATILLHEPFCTMEDNDKSMKRCINAARTILGAIVTLYSSSFDIGLLVPFINFTWAVAGRTLVRELAIKQAKGITEGCDELRYSVNIILAAMRAYKSGLGGSTSSALEALLAHPSTCLPVHQLNEFTRMGHGFAKILDPANPSGAPFYQPQRAHSSKTAAPSAGAQATSPVYNNVGLATNAESAVGIDNFNNRGTSGNANMNMGIGSGTTSGPSPSIDFETLMMMHEASGSFGGGEQRIFEMDDSMDRSPNRSETRGPHEGLGR